MTSEEINQAFRVDRQGDMAVLTPLPAVDKMLAHQIQEAAPPLLEPFKTDPLAGLVIDLSQVKFFQSAFLNFLLRCQMLIKRHGTKMALAGPSEQAREILQLTSLNLIWKIYDTSAEALQGLRGAEKA